MRLLWAGMVFTMVALAQTDATLQKTYDSYLAALKANDVQAVLKQMTKESGEGLASWAPPAKLGALLKDIAKDTVPSSYELQFVWRSKDGKRAAMMALAKVPPDSFHAPKGHEAGAEVKAEVTVSFAQEAGVWKVGDVKIDRSINERPKPKDLNMGKRDDYRDRANTTLGGVVLRLEKQAAGTVYVIKLVDEEAAVFLPAAKVSPAFVPGSIISFDAASHDNDPQKYWAESAQPAEYQF